MLLLDSLSSYVEKEAERLKREARRMLRSKSDQQIRNAYNNCYSGNIKEQQIEPIKEAAFLTIRLKEYTEGMYKTTIIVFVIGLTIYCINFLKVKKKCDEKTNKREKL